MLDRAGLTVDHIDLFELNEAFASVVPKFQKDLNIPDEVQRQRRHRDGPPAAPPGAMILGTMVDELSAATPDVLITLHGGGMGVATITRGFNSMPDNTIQWDKDADGIVTPTMDDPSGQPT